MFFFGEEGGSGGCHFSTWLILLLLVGYLGRLVATRHSTLDCPKALQSPYCKNFPIGRIRQMPHATRVGPFDGVVVAVVGMDSCKRSVPIGPVRFKGISPTTLPISPGAGNVSEVS